MNTKSATWSAAAALVVLCSGQRLSAGNWPQWRGPSFNGSSDETNLPSSWDKTTHIRWTAPMPGPSHATPIIWNDAVFVVSPDAEQNVNLLCLDEASGKVRWQNKLGEGNHPVGNNNMASPSPVTDGQTVWAMCASGVLQAFDFSGKQLWSHNLCDHGRFVLNYTYGSSPTLYKNHLYIEVLQRQDAAEEHPSYLLCLDPKTGAELWRQLRKTDAVEESEEAYTTPIPSENGGHPEIIVAGGDYITGHDASTGAELWRGSGLRNFRNLSSSRLVPSPLVGDGLIYISGPKKNPLLAFRDGGKGDVTAAWQYTEFPTDCVTPLLYQGKLYEFDGDHQMMVCLDPATGKPAWQQSAGVRETFRASPTGADGKLYCMSERATIVVFSAADGKVLSTMKFNEGQAHATIAAAQRCLFVRTAQNLYCVAN